MPIPPDRPDPATGDDAPFGGELDGDGVEKFPYLDDDLDDDLDDACVDDLGEGEGDECACGECTCGECADPDDDPYDGTDEAVDWAVLARRYEIALADYRLDRGHLLWPAVAAAVDAAFTICDPVAQLWRNSNPGAWRTYERAAARIWSGLWSTMLDTIGDRPDVLSLQQQHVHDVVWSVLEDEYGDIGTVSQSVVYERQFAEIIDHAFGGFGGASSGVPRSDSSFSLRPDRVALMVQLIAERLADFPWGSDEPF